MTTRRNHRDPHVVNETGRYLCRNDQFLALGNRQLLARGRLLALVAAAPALVLGWLVATRLERTVGAVVADPAVQSLAAAAGVMLLVVIARERLLLRLDTWLYPEIRDQREALAQVTGALARAEQIATVNRTVIRTVGRGCGAPGALLLAADTAAEAEDFSAPDAKTPPLARTGGHRPHAGDRRRVASRPSQ